MRIKKKGIERKKKTEIKQGQMDLCIEIFMKQFSRANKDIF
jgi:hypothetical protein